MSCPQPELMAIPLPVIYMPHRQAPVAIMNLVLASVGDPSLLAREAEATAWNMSGDVNVYGTEVLSDRIDRFEWSSDVSALLSSDLDHGADEVLVDFVFRKVADEASIDLQVVTGKVLSLWNDENPTPKSSSARWQPICFRAFAKICARSAI